MNDQNSVEEQKKSVSVKKNFAQCIVVLKVLIFKKK